MVADAGRVLARRDSIVARDQQGASKWVLHSCLSILQLLLSAPFASSRRLDHPTNSQFIFSVVKCIGRVAGALPNQQEPTTVCFLGGHIPSARHTLTNSTPVITGPAALMCEFREKFGSWRAQSSKNQMWARPGGLSPPRTCRGPN
ncbi:hypothetical protein BDZ89DRAFT_506400 [Hymenopellis radicata]|nr:hypothetical protein BDZ89DRAFT_506400 [Hymenopellis radicata]